MLKHFVKVSWLKEHLEDSKVFIIDIRYQRNSLEYGKAAYDKGHIPTSEFLYWEEVFMGPVKAHGGYGSLPSTEDFEHKLSEIGFRSDQTLILYGNKLREVARAWFICKYMGIENVKILEGGWSAWKESRNKIETFTRAKREKTHFKSKINYDMICDKSCVQLKKDIETVALIDTRDYKCYMGAELDDNSGHIDGARNYYWRKNLEINSEEKLLKHNQLEEVYRYLEEADEIIVYSKSGVSSCVSYLGLSELGYKISVYLGGISDWLTYTDTSVVRLTDI